MNGLKVAISLLGVLCASPAIAGTTYLKCTYTNTEGQTVVADVALNEATQTADIFFHNTNAGQQWPATFRPKVVEIELGMSNYITISRVNLSFKRVSYFVTRNPRPQLGTCRKVAAPKRAF